MSGGLSWLGIMEGTGKVPMKIAIDLIVSAVGMVAPGAKVR